MQHLSKWHGFNRNQWHGLTEIANYGINRICLGIISGYSGDKEDIQSVQSKNILFDISDDSYVILYYDAEGEGLEGTTPHTHIPSYQVFEPQGYITSNVTSALKAALLK